MSSKLFLRKSVVIYTFLLASLQTFGAFDGKTSYVPQAEKFRGEPWAMQFTKAGDLLITTSGSVGSTDDSSESGWYTWIRKSGETVFELDNKFAPFPKFFSKSFRSTMTEDDNFFVVGRYNDDKNVSHWVLRTRNPKGEWVTLDDYVGEKGFGANAWGVSVTGSKIFVTGGVLEGKFTLPFMKFSSDLGKTFKSISVPKYKGSDWGRAICAFENSDGSLVVAGYGGTQDQSSAQTSFAFVALDGGKTWKDEKIFEKTLIQNCEKDDLGNIFLMGGRMGQSSGTPFLVMSSDGGKTWKDLELDGIPGSKWAWIHGLQKDSHGNYYFAAAFGVGNSTQKTQVRKAECLESKCDWHTLETYEGTDGNDLAAVKSTAMFKDVFYFSGYESTEKAFKEFVGLFVRELH